MIKPLFGVRRAFPDRSLPDSGFMPVGATPGDVGQGDVQ